MRQEQLAEVVGDGRGVDGPVVDVPPHERPLRHGVQPQDVAGHPLRLVRVGGVGGGAELEGDGGTSVAKNTYAYHAGVGGVPYYRGRPVWVCGWVREAGPCASENDTRGVCTGALRVRHPHLCIMRGGMSPNQLIGLND